MVSTSEPHVVKYEKIGSVLALAWSDGREDFIPLANLRAACPCAVCCGEKDLTGRNMMVPTNPSTANHDLMGWELVGGYGFQPRWGDGHRTGIYSQRLLRKLGEAA